MTELTRIALRGADKLEAKIMARAVAIEKGKNLAALAAAKALVPFVKLALPKGKAGYLRRHVKAYSEPGSGIVSNVGVAKVKLTGHEAHLVYGDTKAHEISPRGLQESQGHAFNRRAHARMQGPQQAKQALAWAGAPHPMPHAMRPAHHGAPNPLPRVLEEHRAEAAAAAMEVLKHV